MLQPQVRRRFATVAGLTVTALALVAIGVITLSPAVVTVVLPFWCMRCGARPAIDVLLNVLMFVPLGVGLALLRVRGQVAALAIVLATCAIEATQYGIVAGRFASARDILTNSAGGLAGWYLWSRWRSFAIPPARTARRLGLATAVLWISTQAITAWAHRVVAPAGPWWSQVAMEDPGFSDRFSGDVLELHLGTVRIRASERLAVSDEIRRQLIDGAPITAVVTSAEPTAGPAPIVLLVADDVLSEVLALAQKGTDVYFRVRTRAAVMGFRNPALRLEGVLASGNPNDTVTITAAFSDGRYQLTATRGESRRERILAASPSWIWALLAPISHFSLGPEVRILTATWLLIPFTAIAFWSSRRQRDDLRGAPRALIILAVTAAVIGLGAIPALFGLSIAHWSEWLAAALGTLAGWWLAGLASAYPSVRESAVDDPVASRPAIPRPRPTPS